MSSSPILSSARRLASLIAGIGLLAPAVACSQDAPASTPGATASTQDTTASADPGWPREVSKDGATLTYYQPQIDGWKDYKELTGRVAFSLTPKGGKPAIGVASLKAKTQADKDAGVVVIKSIEVVQTRFPALDSSRVNPSDKLFRQLFPTAGMTVSLDRIVAGAEKGKTGAKPVPVRTEPPPIFVSEQRAILLFVDGDPVRVPVDSTSSLAFVVNTNWTLFQDSGTDQYYLLDDKTWQSASELKGPWSVTTSLPKSFSSLPAGDEFADVRRALPAAKPATAVKPVFHTATPGELIEFTGRPVYAEIPQTRLLYGKNTETDLFVHKDQSQYYVLLSGRWFRAKSLQGPWSYAGNDLPADFGKIPPASQKSAVLASVPGTQEAADAVLLAEIPTTAVVNRAEAEKNVKVVYDGPPAYSPIEKTSVSYATNTESKVILAGGKYYLCYQGVWFVSSSANGPWKTADMIPASIYTIPPSSPVYNVTYVTVVDPTPTTVTASYTSGYTGVFIMGMAVGAAVVYGSGYYYPPYMYRPPYGYPVYRPYPYTYAAGARYNPYTGGYAVGRAAYGPYGGAGQAAWYNPSTGRYGRASTVQTPYGGRTAATSYNPYTGVRASTRQGSSPYGQWGSTAVQRGNDWAVTNRVTTNQGTVRQTTTSSGAQGTTVRGPGGQTTRVGTDGNNNVYAGHDGNVYKKDAGGGWQKYDNGGWSSAGGTGASTRPSTQPSTGAAPRPSTQPSQMPSGSATPRPSGGVPNDVQRDFSSRERGSQRAARSGSYGGGSRRR
ncbi:MAG TPA: hypothetical protein VNO19_01085 [Gemmatimonadales bacterium]|nr:hypothetical protein [Gemmatimonadales bacterium]